MNPDGSSWKLIYCRVSLFESTKNCRACFYRVIVSDFSMIHQDLMIFTSICNHYEIGLLNGMSSLSKDYEPSLVPHLKHQYFEDHQISSF